MKYFVSCDIEVEINYLQHIKYKQNDWIIIIKKTQRKTKKLKRTLLSQQKVDQEKEFKKMSSENDSLLLRTTPPGRSSTTHRKRSITNSTYFAGDLVMDDSSTSITYNENGISWYFAISSTSCLSWPARQTPRRCIPRRGNTL